MCDDFSSASDAKVFCSTLCSFGMEKKEDCPLIFINLSFITRMKCDGHCCNWIVKRLWMSCMCVMRKDSSIIVILAEKQAKKQVTPRWFFLSLSFKPSMKTSILFPILFPSCAFQRQAQAALSFFQPSALAEFVVGDQHSHTVSHWTNDHRSAHPKLCAKDIYIYAVAN